ncbi:hypothetical protein LA345_40735 (plasmid) [Burkholderia vietnamiensis]|uniref:Uncharacterized protein n=1 Tax=Burkholderia vietnamiensis (strain G4 / LMG 22486) TaxID=269482 RepID=A4JTW5_BURVG|nr:hypothetical protein Bcep1808_6831 [Burkholderia vietnamiensis G4]MCB4350123.1 hypothetical protein [Burkholderia vietnamiensis]
MQLHEALKKVIDAANTQLEDIKSGIDENLYDPAQNDPGGLETAIAVVESAMSNGGSLAPALVLVSVSGGVSNTAQDGNVNVQTVDFDNLAVGDEAPTLPPEFRDLVETTFGEQHYKGIRYEGENTRLDLIYCDAGNYRVSETVVLAGAISSKQLELIRSKLEDGCQIIAHQVGLPTPAVQQRDNDGFPNDELDHVFTTLEVFESGHAEIDDLLTQDPPTHAFTIDELMQRFAAVQSWDIAAEWERLLSLA